mmetsp:Transcript_1316/g.3072  ORF Transcript_1316/g.3072 Transcript_1316/m.3072 type:complete len:94 (+) Transcript_1316:258-539(+)
MSRPRGPPRTALRSSAISDSFSLLPRLSPPRVRDVPPLSHGSSSSSSRRRQQQQEHDRLSSDGLTVGHTIAIDRSLLDGQWHLVCKAHPEGAM